MLGDWLGLEYELRAAADGWSIRMAGDVTNRAIALPDIFLATGEQDWLAPASLPRRPLASVPAEGVERLPVLFGDGIAGAPAWRPEPGGGRLSIDVFGSVFFLLSRYEEAVPGERDAHGRFTAAQSIAAAERFVDRPIADAYVDLLWTALEATWHGLTRRPSTFRLRLTHDVDRPWATLGRPLRAVLPGMGADLVRRRAPLLALQRGRAALDARHGRFDRDPYDTYDFLMATSERHGLRSTFYFMAGNAKGDVDFRYTLREPSFGPLLRRIRDRGHEIGLHASYGSFETAERIASEFRALVEVCGRAGVEQASWASASTTSASITRLPGGPTRQPASSTTPRSALRTGSGSAPGRAANSGPSTSRLTARSTCGNVP